MTALTDEAYDAALITHARDLVDAAAQASIEAYSTAALAGLSQEACEAEQLAAFAEYLAR